MNKRELYKAILDYALEQCRENNYKKIELKTFKMLLKDDINVIVDSIITEEDFIKINKED